MTEIRIVPGSKKYLDDMYAAEKACFRSPWAREELAEDLEKPISRYLVMLENEKLIGYAGFWLLMEEAHITNVAVLPEYRGQGLGKRLVKELIQLASDCGAKFMELECRVSNDVARRMYHNLGFLRVGLRKGYYTDTGEDAVVMALIVMPPPNEENDPFLVYE